MFRCMKQMSADERECTEEGIKFLMLDTYNQLWLLLKQYTEAAAIRSGTAGQRFPHSL